MSTEKPDPAAPASDQWCALCSKPATRTESGATGYVRLCDSCLPTAPVQPYGVALPKALEVDAIAVAANPPLTPAEIIHLFQKTSDDWAKRAMDLSGQLGDAKRHLIEKDKILEGLRRRLDAAENKSDDWRVKDLMRQREVLVTAANVATGNATRFEAEVTRLRERRDHYKETARYLGAIITGGTADAESVLVWASAAVNNPSRLAEGDALEAARRILKLAKPRGEAK